MYSKRVQVVETIYEIKQRVSYEAMGEVLELAADVASDMSGLAVAFQMNLYLCDH